MLLFFSFSEETLSAWTSLELSGPLNRKGENKIYIKKYIDKIEVWWVPAGH